ncbi:hypothetical protein [Streptomyces sp. NPDC051567]|uniref:hypothetical protein n=1 Tax=Streptomyces sp. NPDC051567 TaxID=3365660 RepID=UPI0037B7FC12
MPVSTTTVAACLPAGGRSRQTSGPTRPQAVRTRHPSSVRDPREHATPSPPGFAHALEAGPEILPIGVTVSALQRADESRAGYKRDFRRWNTGEDKAGGCSTRVES